MPGPISGFSQPIGDIIPFHILSSESSFGIPMEAFGTLVLGFVLFGAALQFTGGGAFFNDLAFRMVGKYRGGAAKVATVGSGLMGSMSGSVISNIMTTGAVSIPAMKRTGFSANYAAGVEACALPGGLIMPSIMRAIAFVIGSFLGVGYAEIVLAPALVQAGLHPIAAHLFIMYWGMVSYITPPVALGAFAAATLAGTGPIRAGFTAMRLGSIIYVLPFLFVLEPALIGVGEWSEVIPVMVLAFFGVWLIASGTQGYLAVFGPLGHGKLGIVVQVCIIAGGVAIAVPATLVPVFGHVGMTVLGLIFVAIGLGICSVTMRRQS